MLIVAPWLAITFVELAELGGETAAAGAVAQPEPPPLDVPAPLDEPPPLDAPPPRDVPPSLVELTPPDEAPPLSDPPLTPTVASGAEASGGCEPPCACATSPYGERCIVVAEIVCAFASRVWPGSACHAPPTTVLTAKALGGRPA